MQPYIIVISEDYDRLARQVSERMHDGYIPQGSLIISGRNKIQPMVLKAKNE